MNKRGEERRHREDGEGGERTKGQEWREREIKQKSRG